MIVEIYKKKGNLPLKEKNMVAQIRERLTKLMEKDPSFKITPAETPAELAKLYHKICSDEVEFEDVNSDHKRQTSSKEPEMEENLEEVETASQEAPKSNAEFKEKNTLSDFDPFSETEVRVRNYVLEEEFNTIHTNESGATIEDFSEPTTFKESFQIPSQEEKDDLTELEDDEEVSNSSSQQAPPPRNTPPPRPEPRESMNPNYDNMDSARQKKKTKRFAKQIVALTCDLLERGFEWYAGKDITEAKLTQYELNEEMDLSLLVDMPNGQQATVKNFFLSQHKMIKQESKINEEDREDLTDALTEVMLEKGIAPTPMQELALVGARILAVQVIKAVSITSSNNAILNQLRGFKKEETAYETQEEPTPAYKEPIKQEEKKVDPDLSQNTKSDIPPSKSKNKAKGKSTEAPMPEELTPFTEIATKE